MTKFCLAVVMLCVSFFALGGNGEGRSSYPGDFDTDTPLPAETVLDLADFPAPPNAASLRPIYVSAEATNLYFIDEATLALGTDQVVRYVIVVETAGGVRNVSFEGIRCSNRAWKLFAVGRPDGSWAKPRTSEWRMIEKKLVNGHHAALTRDYFCPNGDVIRTTEDGQRALQLGKNRDAK